MRCGNVCFPPAHEIEIVQHSVSLLSPLFDTLLGFNVLLGVHLKYCINYYNRFC